jgi:hypothetical protein
MMMNGLDDGARIVTHLAGEKSSSNEFVNLLFDDHDGDAAQAQSATLPVTAHAFGRVGADWRRISRYLVRTDRLEADVRRSRPNWVYEVNGYGLFVRKTADRVRIFTRRGAEWTHRFPRIIEARPRSRLTVHAPPLTTST